ncbi:rRNA-processing protein Fcf1/Utp23 [Kipferlia bialata]|uniref:rRNA-processing protein Fcf1/Utp23 n=1 Tax=Kipferlia bialata TaxID=797122 RepID=A0A9K3CYV6_9EUKA|nr:rRNA-processing protein Fcf1/Utp23 [Kipferlia bialata]|eukprot:g7211.t1
MAEIEILARRYPLCRKIAKDPRILRLSCAHPNKGYGDDCLCRKVEASRIYIVATNDRELRQRCRKIPGVPVMFSTRAGYKIERLPDAQQF